MGLFRRRRDPAVAVRQFWDWWVAEGKDATALLLDDVHRDPAQLEPLAQEIGRRMAPTGLAWELGPGEASRHALVATTEGDRSLLDVAAVWLGAAPVEDVVFEYAVGRRPVADPAGFAVALEDSAFSVEDATVSARRRGDGLVDVVVHHAGFVDLTHEQAGTVTFLMLDALLGEHAVETRVGGVEFDASYPPGSVPLVDLREIVREQV